MDTALIGSGKQRWPRMRLDRGFYSEVETISIENSEVLFGASPLQIRHLISPNYMADNLPVSARGVSAQAFAYRDPHPVAYVEFDVIGKRNDSRLEDREFLNACDTINSTLCSLAESLLQSSVDEIDDVLNRGPILHLSRLEVRGDQTGKGIAATLAKSIVAMLEQRIGLSLLAIKPFPLQFESCAPELDSLEYPEFQAAFDAAELKLSGFYQRSFGVKCIREYESHLIAPLNGLEMDIDEFGWSLREKEAL